MFSTPIASPTGRRLQFTSPPVVSAADSAAKVPEAAWVSAEPVWAVTVDLALVRSRFMSNRVD